FHRLPPSEISVKIISNNRHRLAKIVGYNLSHMTRLRRRTKILMGIVLAWILFLFVNNTSMFSRRASGSPVILVRRGMSQRYAVPDRLDNCAASQMLPPEDELFGKHNSIDAEGVRTRSRHRRVRRSSYRRRAVRRFS